MSNREWTMAPSLSSRCAAGRVARGGCPPPALTEPDLWATHPAPQRAFSRLNSKYCPSETMNGPGCLRCHSCQSVYTRDSNQALG